LETGSAGLLGKSSVKVLFVCNSVKFFVSHRFQIAEALVARGHDVHVAALFNHDDSVEKLEEIGVGCHNIRFALTSKSLVKLSTEYRWVLAIVKELSPDVVHCITLKAILLGGCLPTALGIPKRIYSIAGLGTIFSSKTLVHLLAAFVLKRLMKIIFLRSGTFVIVQNDRDKKFILGLGVDPDNILITGGSGVDLTEFQKAPIPSHFSCLMGCRMLKQKGVLIYIEAARSLYEKYGLSFVLAGPFDYNHPDSVNPKVIEDAVAAGFLQYLGEVKDMDSLLKRTAVAVLPTFYAEGKPKFLLEALACGRPIITTSLPGCAELVEDSEANGLIIEPQNVASLAAAILKCREWHRSGHLGRMGANSRRIAESSYDVNSVVDIHIALYEAGESSI